MRTSRIQKKQSAHGFSLVEILVSLGLFMVVVTISVGALLALIDANAKAQTIKTSMDNLSFAVDAMSRKIRTGFDYHCDGSISGSFPSGTNDCSTAESGLVYTDGKTGDRIGYRLNGTQIERKINTGSWLAITADEIQINELAFVVEGTTQGDTNQPTVAIWIEGQAGNFDDTRSFFEIQTTVAQRILDL